MAAVERLRSYARGWPRELNGGWKPASLLLWATCRSGLDSDSGMVSTRECGPVGHVTSGVDPVQLACPRARPREDWRPLAVSLAYSFWWSYDSVSHVTPHPMGGVC